jgi:hypothetical protein
VVLAIVGFFLIPVVASSSAFRSASTCRSAGGWAAWHATREALRAMGLSIVIELSATVIAASLAGGSAELSSRVSRKGHLGCRRAGLDRPVRLGVDGGRCS